LTNSESHLAAQELFDRTADAYRAHADARVYDLTSLVFARRKMVVLSHLDETGLSGTLLDFGMGPGVFAPDAAARGFRFVGVDISQAMVERAEALGIPDATYVQGDLDALERFRGSVDVVLAVGLIDYLEDPRDGLRRLVECLRPGGALIVSFRNRWAINTVLRNAAKVVWRALFRTPKWRTSSAFVSSVHEKSFTAGELRDQLRSLRMDEIAVRYHNVTPFLFVNVPIPRRLWETWLRVDGVLSRFAPRPLCDAGVVRAGRRS
jgi:SAM-dependent methyltransferase